MQTHLRSSCKVVENGTHCSSGIPSSTLRDVVRVFPFIHLRSLEWASQTALRSQLIHIVSSFIARAIDAGAVDIQACAYLRYPCVSCPLECRRHRACHVRCTLRPVRAHSPIIPVIHKSTISRPTAVTTCFLSKCSLFRRLRRMDRRD